MSGSQAKNHCIRAKDWWNLTKKNFKICSFITRGSDDIYLNCRIRLKPPKQSTKATKYHMGRRPKACETVTMGDEGLELSMELLLRLQPLLFCAYHMPNSARISTARVTILCRKQKSKLAVPSNEIKGEKGLYDWFNNDYIHWLSMEA